MGSSFMGLETSKRGLFTQQSALYTTGNNISNANTLGYSRQRVNMEATAGFPGVGLNTGTMPGFLGTGVQAGSIQRIRDSFIDHQYRQESTKLGYWESKSNAITQMEDVLNEPSYYGLQSSLSEFWKSLQDLAVNPSESGARTVVIRRGEAIADSFSHMHKSLSDIQTNIGKEIDVSTKDINSILKQVAELNKQISEVEPNGYLPNDLYDARDLLLDELSMYVPIETSYEKSGGRALGIAEGTVTVSLKLKDGTKVELVKGSQHGELEASPQPLLDEGTNKNNPITGISIKPAGGGQAVEHGHADFVEYGKLKSLMNSYGTLNQDGTVSGLYPDMIAELNKMAREFADAFNKIYETGHPIEGDAGPLNFFVIGSVDEAANLKVHAELIADSSLFRASDKQDEEGNGNQAQALADLKSKGIDNLGGASIDGYFQSVIGKLGVDGKESERLTLNSLTLLGAVEHRRASVSAVSLDEEMTDMIRFQQAYNASARMITVVDETLDKIINGMGIVGR